MARAVLFTALVLLVLVPGPASAAQLDRGVPGGWWYSQTGSANELGFAIVDDGQARFWSEFKRLGGVDALGYPVSQRFQLDGFTVQATQRVLMQWRPELGAVQFVNVFDRLHDAGHDGWLRATRQTPPPAAMDETGKVWEQIVRDRVALMDAYPAIKAKYSATVGDAIQANGLPTSTVSDMGNHLALRAQRVVFQQWKEDVPWAKAGQVTVALGGDIFKEVGMIPAEALKAAPGPEGGAPAEMPATAATPVPAPPRGVPSIAPSMLTAPLAGSPDRFLIAPADLPGSRVVEELALDANVLARGRRNPPLYAARLTETGFSRGFRRILARGSGRQLLVAIAEVDLFQDPESAHAYIASDAREGVVDPAFRMDPLPSPALGDEAAAFRIVDGDVAARGYLVMLRKANAVAFVSVLAQVAMPTLDDAVLLARAMESRLR